MSLDSGYLSRLLRALENQGLVRSRRASGDGRVRRATLTRQGLGELKELDRRAEAFAASLLAPLSAARRDRLVAAMTEVERLMQVSAVEVSVEDPDAPEARWCLKEYFRELAGRFDTGFDPTKSISADPEELTAPAGVFLIARLDGRPVGCGAIKVKGRKIGEVKRMWVAASARGLGLGRRILEALEEQAREMGLRVLRLETNRALKEAQALYRQSGYREVAPFNDELYAHHWFEKVGLNRSRVAGRPTSPARAARRK
jgi:GNAT superfamily N-acetyltransferase